MHFFSLKSPIFLSDKVKPSEGLGLFGFFFFPINFNVTMVFFLLGKYVMVMGVIQAYSPEPCLQAVKMTDLSDNPVHESMWALEVEDLHRNIP